MNKKKRRKIIGIELAILVVIILGIVIFLKTDKKNSQSAKKSTETKEKQHQKKRTEVKTDREKDDEADSPELVAPEKTKDVEEQPKKLEGLEAELREAEPYSIYVKSLEDGESFSVRNGKMQAASLIKLYIAGAVYEKADVVWGYLGKERMQTEMRKMITVSDNAAANTLVKALGQGDVAEGMRQVNSYCESHGFGDTVMGRLLLADRKHGDNITSVQDTGEILSAFYNHDLAGGEEILAYMKEQTRREKIPACLPEGVICANKTGELSDVENDSAVIYAEGHPYVCVVMREDVAAPGNVRKAIASLSQRIYQYMTALPEENTKGTVAIDAGHQKNGNPGLEPVGPGAKKNKAKVSGGTQGAVTHLPEYELTLQVALKLEKALEDAGYRVLMIRKLNDVDISNSERAQMANAAEADAFIRLHANGCGDKSVSGIMTICQTKDNPYNGALYEKSYRLSACILDALVETTGARKERVSERDDMTGINYANVPVTIVEMGYMTNPKEDRLMASEAYQEKIVQGITKGIQDFMEK